MPTDALADLNPAQREAATIVRGPVAIWAGAGTGKTTTITHRIANQVATGAFAADRILAVTFTTKAAAALRDRLARLGVDGVDARTFHSAALAELRWLWTETTGEPLAEVLDHKAPLIATFANALPPPHRFLPRRELAGEIEWAKNRRIGPERYLEALGEHVPPVPPPLMHRVYDGYERRKTSMGRVDFEDLLGLAVRLLEEHPDAAAAMRDRFHAFTVDEYQDVNPLQTALLDAWLGDRDDLCVVGDDHQTIYSFTGASPAPLRGFADRFPHAAVVGLTENYRSTPEVLALANRLAPHIGSGPARALEPTRPEGPPPAAQPFADEAAETAGVVAAVGELHRDAGVPLEEIAIIVRINARSEAFEEAFAADGVPYQVKDGAFLGRPGPRAVVAALRRATGEPVAAAVARVTGALGYDPSAVPGADDEATRQSDLGRMRVLADEYGADGGDVAGFLEELASRFSAERDGRGVQLLTYHRAKGLEFDAVFLPRLVDGELPFRSGRAKADPEEERRLLYVGITRARRHLFLTWSREGRARPSPYLSELGAVATKAAVARASGSPAFEALRRWRADRARADGVPAYVIFHDRTLDAIAAAAPRDLDDLALVQGVGPAKLARYGDEVLALVAAS